MLLDPNIIMLLDPKIDPSNKDPITININPNKARLSESKAKPNISIGGGIA